MKKMVMLLWMTLLLPLAGYAQNIKIGDIEISDQMAKEYFLDCYTHPDTIQSRQFKEGDWFDQKMKKRISTYHPSRKAGDSIKITATDSFNFFIIVPREPSAADFRDWFIRNQQRKANKRASEKVGQ